MRTLPTGKLMGIAVRNKEHLNLSLPSLFWKHLLGEPVGEADLEEVDENVVRALRLTQSAVPEDPVLRGSQLFTVRLLLLLLLLL